MTLHREVLLFGLLVLLAVLLAIFLGCDVPSKRRHPPSTTPLSNAQPPDGRLNAVQYILENPSAYEGARLIVGGDIVDIWSPRAFTVIGRQFPENDTLLVVMRNDLTALECGGGAIGLRGASVRVTGRVHTGIHAAERELERPLSETVRNRAAATGPVFVAELVAFVRPSDAASR
jgi:hypothetical protein